MVFFFVVVTGTFENVEVTWFDDFVVVVVMVVEGYLGLYVKGEKIINFDVVGVIDGVKVFYVGIVFDVDGDVVFSGGRVFGVIVYGFFIIEVVECVYEVVDVIEWLGGFICRDIGWCVIVCEKV